MKQNELKWGPEELARQSGINRRTLDKYFEGDSPSPSFFLISALGGALGVSLDDLAPQGANPKS
jgi:transcriptional regulator with XRE-family HTH domain